jgi:hypothetical protein
MLVSSCDSLPENFVMACKAGFISYGRVLIGLVRDQINEQPRVLCEKYGACTPTSQFALFFKKPSKVCAPCQLAVNIAKNYVAEISDVEIHKLLGQVCTFAPVEYQSMCRMLVAMGADSVVVSLRTFFKDDAKTICQKIGTCV